MENSGLTLSIDHAGETGVLEKPRYQLNIDQRGPIAHLKGEHATTTRRATSNILANACFSAPLTRVGRCKPTARQAIGVQAKASPSELHQCLVLS